MAGFATHLSLDRLPLSTPLSAGSTALTPLLAPVTFTLGNTPLERTKPAFI